MKVCILSKGRAGNVTTQKQFDPQDVMIFVEPQEYDAYVAAYPDIEIVNIQKNDQGILYVRNFILDYMRGQKYVMSDDDVTQFFYRDENARTKYTHALNGKNVLPQLETRLDTYCVVTVPLRNYAQMQEPGIRDYGIARQFFAINGATLPENIRFDTNLKLLEDLDFSIQLLVNKVPMGLDYDFCMYSKYVSKGGNEKAYEGSAYNKNLELLEQLKHKWGEDLLSIRRRTGTDVVISFGPNYRRIMGKTQKKVIRKKYKQIMIDAVDGCGKTTVCEILSKKLGWPIVKMPSMPEYFKKGMTEEFSKLFNDTIVQFSHVNFIMDRGYTSSLVYSKIYNRDFDLSYLEDIEAKLNNKVIILTGDDEELFRRRPSDEIIKKEFRAGLNAEYVRLAKERNYQLIDTTHLSPEQVADEILKTL